MRIHTTETLATMTPNKALQFLKDGNARFVNNLKLSRNHLDEIQYYLDGQYPFAVILSCMDSRTTTELIFDQGLGDILSLRIAGNVLNDDIIGSMEYACKIVGSKLIMVLGHSKCGATRGACCGLRVGRFTNLLNHFDVSIDEVKKEMSKEPHDSQKFIDAVTQHNVLHSMSEILTRSVVLKELYDKGEIGLVAAYHHLGTGEVEFLYEDLPKNNE